VSKKTLAKVAFTEKIIGCVMTKATRNHFNPLRELIGCKPSVRGLPPKCEHNLLPTNDTSLAEAFNLGNRRLAYLESMVKQAINIEQVSPLDVHAFLTDRYFIS
jgi:hypothetical protein